VHKTIQHIILFLIMTVNVYSVESQSSDTQISSEFTLQELRIREGATSIRLPHYSAALAAKAYLTVQLPTAIPHDSSIKIRLNGVTVAELNAADREAKKQVELDLPLHQDALIELQTNTPGIGFDSRSKIVYSLDKTLLPRFGELITQQQRAIPVYTATIDKSTLEATFELISAIGANYYPWKITADFHPSISEDDETPKVVIVDKEAPFKFHHSLTAEEANLFVAQQTSHLGVMVLSDFSYDTLARAAKLIELEGRLQRQPAIVYLRKGAQGLNIECDYLIALVDEHDLTCLNECHLPKRSQIALIK
jgi:hypothetical protein